MRKKCIHSGQMLIEIVVAVAIIALVLVGISDLSTRSSRTGTFQRQRDEAFSIAQKVLSDYRVQRDTNPDSFYDTIAGNTMDPCVVDKPYVCVVVVDKTVDSVLMTVTVQWDDGGETFDVSLTQLLTRDVR